MRSAAEAVRKTMPKVRVFVMDSAIAAVSGCLYDRPEPKGDSAVALNVGNSHVTASIVRQHQLVGFMEHHTALLSPYKLVRFLRKLQSRTLTSNEISSDGGHGAFYLDGSTIRGNNVVLVTGPRRRIVEETGLKVRYAAPTGDVMMTGVYGLVKAVERMLR